MIMTGVARRSRRTRNKPPEIVPPKSDDSDQSDSEGGNEDEASTSKDQKETSDEDRETETEEPLKKNQSRTRRTLKKDAVVRPARRTRTRKVALNSRPTSPATTTRRRRRTPNTSEDDQHKKDGKDDEESHDSDKSKGDGAEQTVKQEAQTKEAAGGRTRGRPRRTRVTNKAKPEDDDKDEEDDEREEGGDGKSTGSGEKEKSGESDEDDDEDSDDEPISALRRRKQQTRKKKGKSDETIGNSSDENDDTRTSATKKVLASSAASSGDDGVSDKDEQPDNKSRTRPRRKRRAQSPVRRGRATRSSGDEADPDEGAPVKKRRRATRGRGPKVANASSAEEEDIIDEVKGANDKPENEAGQDNMSTDGEKSEDKARPRRTRKRSRSESSVGRTPDEKGSDGEDGNSKSEGNDQSEKIIASVRGDERDDEGNGSQIKSQSGEKVAAQSEDDASSNEQDADRESEKAPNEAEVSSKAGESPEVHGKSTVKPRSRSRSNLDLANGDEKNMDEGMDEASVAKEESEHAKPSDETMQDALTESTTNMKSEKDRTTVKMIVALTASVEAVEDAAYIEEAKQVNLSSTTPETPVVTTSVEEGNSNVKGSPTEAHSSKINEDLGSQTKSATENEADQKESQPQPSAPKETLETEVNVGKDVAPDQYEALEMSTDGKDGEPSTLMLNPVKDDDAKTVDSGENVKHLPDNDDALPRRQMAGESEQIEPEVHHVAKNPSTGSITKDMDENGSKVIADKVERDDRSKNVRTSKDKEGGTKGEEEHQSVEKDISTVSDSVHVQDSEAPDLLSKSPKEVSPQSQPTPTAKEITTLAPGHDHLAITEGDEKSSGLENTEHDEDSQEPHTENPEGGPQGSLGRPVLVADVTKAPSVKTGISDDANLSKEGIRSPINPQDLVIPGEARFSDLETKAQAAQSRVDEAEVQVDLGATNPSSSTLLAVNASKLLEKQPQKSFVNGSISSNDVIKTNSYLPVVMESAEVSNAPQNKTGSERIVEAMEDRINARVDATKVEVGSAIPPSEMPLNTQAEFRHLDEGRCHDSSRANDTPKGGVQTVGGSQAMGTDQPTNPALTALSTIVPGEGSKVQNEIPSVENKGVAGVGMEPSISAQPISQDGASTDGASKKKGKGTLLGLKSLQMGNREQTVKTIPGILSLPLKFEYTVKFGQFASEQPPMEKCLKSPSLPVAVLAKNKIMRVKAAMYSVGSRVHRGVGFERIFAEYWDAMALRLSERLSRHSSQQCQQAIEKFLTTSKLRKLHNQFVLNLIRNCSKKSAQSIEVAAHIPQNWKERVKSPQLSATIESKTNITPKPAAVNFVEDDLPNYTEAWCNDDDNANTKAVLPSSVPIRHETPPGTKIAPSRVPGALVVDPLVRKLVSSNNMQVSELAVWLMSVAVKQHTKQFLKAAIAQKESIEGGCLPRRSLEFPNKVAGIPSSKKEGSEKPTDKQKRDGSETSRRKLTTLDLHIASTTYPHGRRESVGGSIPRNVIERSLHASYDNLCAVPGDDLFHVQSFITNQILSAAKSRAQQEKAKSESIASHPSTSNPTLRKEQSSFAVPASSAVVGRQQQPSVHPVSNHAMDPLSQASADFDSSVKGRGAKDLASLMKRTSEPEKPVHGAAPADASLAQPADSQAEAEGPQMQPNDTTAAAVEQPAGKGPAGKGFGTKNLAALRACATTED